MEKEEKEGKTTSSSKSSEEGKFVLQWGKRIQRVRFKEPSNKPLARKITSPFNRGVTDGARNGKSPSPEKEERFYTTRGLAAAVDKGNGNGNEREDKGKVVWPKLYITLSTKEKEEDFFAMKGCKLPQRPKKRAKFIQRTLLLVSPGAWLTDMCQERYEVREKKTPKKTGNLRGIMSSVMWFLLMNSV